MLFWSPEDFANATIWDIEDASLGWAESNGYKKKEHSFMTRAELEELKRKFPDNANGS